MKIRPLLFTPSDWDFIKLVVFDVDGTLYNQRKLRWHMACDLLVHAILMRDLKTNVILRAYRRIRERLADEESSCNDVTVVTETANVVGCTPEAVQKIVAEWIEQRPLRYLVRCRYQGLPELFNGLRRKGKIIGILSDYPARAKLAALELYADYFVSSDDPDIGYFKPHTRGLECLIAAAGVNAKSTILIGDRIERDGIVANRLGVNALIRSSQPIKHWQTFASFDSPLFAPMLS